MCARPTRGVCDRTLREHRESPGLPPFLFPLPQYCRGWPDGPSLLALSDHRFIVRALRAQTTFWPLQFSLSPPPYWRTGLGLPKTARVQRGPSEAARCASTGSRQATLLFPLLLFPNMKGSGQGCPRLRTTFSPTQPRARRYALLSQASTDSSCAFYEQGEHLAAPFLFFPIHCREIDRLLERASGPC